MHSEISSRVRHGELAFFTPRELPYAREGEDAMVHQPGPRSQANLTQLTHFSAGKARKSHSSDLTNFPSKLGAFSLELRQMAGAAIFS
jgi:hypothetical protein